MHDTLFPDPPHPVAVASRREFAMHRVPPTKPVADVAEFVQRSNDLCASFDKGAYQHFVQAWLSPRTPYRSLLLYHGLGVGKTCSAVTIAETLLRAYRAQTPLALNAPPVLVITSRALQKSFHNEIHYMSDTADVFSTCTQDTYRHLMASAGVPPTPERLKAFIAQRYAFYTYEGFATVVEGMNDAQVRARFKEVTCIVDEAHNLRDASEGAQGGKRVAAALVRALSLAQGQSNRLVLLSATPMYNEPEEIVYLLALLALNDGRKELNVKRLPKLLDKEGQPIAATWRLVERLAQRYVSHVRSQNPFTFALRLSPKASRIPVLESPAWTRRVPDGLVGTPLGDAQRAALAEVKGKKMAMANLLQACTLVVPVTGKPRAAVKYRMGRTGILSLVRRVDDARPLQATYLPGTVGAMDPRGAWLASAGPKLARVADFVARAEGIVVIYSQFVWSGVVPMAMVLEHLGFRRFHDRDMLAAPAKTNVPPLATVPRYAILCDDEDVRSSMSIADIVRQINGPQNLGGDVIKVVLMTPVASEGLSFANVREVHLLDPWYHFNRAEQVIGRAIRKCSHRALPVSERNVTVFLHASIDGESNGGNETETPDLAAYRIAVEKQHWITRLEKALQSNAVDCHLFVHQNHLPKRLFQFAMTLKTSQGATVLTRLGEDDEARVPCAETGTAIETRGAIEARNEITTHTSGAWRWEVYAHWIPTLRARIVHAARREIREGRAPRAVTYEELETWADPSGLMEKDAQKAAILASVAPFRVWATEAEAWGLVPHREGVWLQSLETAMPIPTKRMLAPPMPRPSEKPNAAKSETKKATSPATECAWQRRLDGLPSEQDAAFSFMLYQLLDSQCWPSLAEGLLDPASAISSHAKAAGVRAVLVSTGALVKAAEIERLGKNDPLVGYTDLFESPDAALTSHPTFMVRDEKTVGRFREGTQAERAAFQRHRQPVPMPSPLALRQTVAVMVPQRSTAELRQNPNAPYRFAFKLLRYLPEAENAKRIRGIECESLKIAEIDALLDSVGQAQAKGTGIRIAQKCPALAAGMMARERVWLPPGWRAKPPPVRHAKK